MAANTNDPPIGYITKPVRLIVAHDKNHGIGYIGRIPWRCPKDMQHFRDVTTATVDPAKQNAVLMGRRTWESLHGRLLPNRFHACVSSTRQEGIDTYASVPEAVQALSQKPRIEAIFAIGGVHVYREVLESYDVETIYVTRIHSEFPTDREVKFVQKHLKNRSFKRIMGTEDFDIFRYR